jgi:hypothetical protein
MTPRLIPTFEKMLCKVYELHYLGSKSTSREGERGDSGHDGEEGKDSGEHFDVRIQVIKLCLKIESMSLQMQLGSAYFTLYQRTPK